jgi:uncharacterized membrane protein YdbT with pleckstrin-like domain
MNEEITRSSITPSQWINAMWALLAGAGIEMWLETGSIWWGIPILILIYKVIAVECHQYIFDDNKDVIVERKGVFSVQKVDIHYWRVKSVQIKQPFLMRLVGISIVEIITSEPFKPFLRLYAISDGEEYAKFIQECATYYRSKMGVKETDFHSF